MYDETEIPFIDLDAIVPPEEPLATFKLGGRTFDVMNPLAVDVVALDRASKADDVVGLIQWRVMPDQREELADLVAASPELFTGGRLYELLERLTRFEQEFMANRRTRRARSTRRPATGRPARTVDDE